MMGRAMRAGAAIRYLVPTFGKAGSMKRVRAARKVGTCNPLIVPAGVHLGALVAESSIGNGGY